MLGSLLRSGIYRNAAKQDSAMFKLLGYEASCRFSFCGGRMTMSCNRLWLASVAASAALLLAATASAVPVMDGSASGSDGYGTALSVQNTQTQFGDNNGGDLVATANGGSEIDQVFGVVANGRLYVTITGNLEKNFNKLEVFIDSVSGGVNEVIGSQLPAAVDAFCCGGLGTTDGALQRQDGLIFDANFNADRFLTFSHGGENVGGRGFWAISAHYADLTQGTSGSVVRAGMQLAPLGMPNVLRGPLGPDFNSDFDVDGQDFLTWQRGFGTGTTKPEGDADGSGTVDGLDLAQWQDRYGTDRNLTDFPFNPFIGGPSTTSLIGPALPGLSPGQLIDQNYAMGAGGCSADGSDGGAGCVAPELEFVLPVDSDDPTNTKNHRDFNNTIGLEMAFNNSNVAGVEGGSGAIVTGDPQNVITGLEFSIPLSALGNPTGDIKLLAYVNGTGHDFSSNQYSGTGILQGNFGSLFPDLEAEAAGEQFVTIPNGALDLTAVPEPSTFVMIGLAAAGCLCGRRSS
jgi:hypothetical protein